MDQTLIFAFAAIMIVVGVAFLYLLLGKSPGFRPRDGMEWVGSILSVLLILVAVLLITMQFMTASEGQRLTVTSTGITATKPEDISLDMAAGPVEWLRDAATAEDLASLEGNVVLLNFWATWCAPCLQEMPELNRLQQQYAERGLRVVNISDEDPQMLDAFWTRFSMETTNGRVQPGTELEAPFIGALEVRPTSYVIDRDGRVRRYILGARNYGFFERAVTPYL